MLRRMLARFVVISNGLLLTHIHWVVKSVLRCDTLEDTAISCCRGCCCEGVRGSCVELFISSVWRYSQVKIADTEPGKIGNTKFWLSFCATLPSLYLRILRDTFIGKRAQFKQKKSYFYLLLTQPMQKIVKMDELQSTVCSKGGKSK